MTESYFLIILIKSCTHISGTIASSVTTAQQLHVEFGLTLKLYMKI